MNILKKFRLLFGKSDIIVMDASTARCIADMQKDLDAYGFVFTNLIGYLNGKFGADGKKAPAIGYCIAASKEVNNQISMLYGAVVSIVKHNEECIEAKKDANSFADKVAGEYKLLNDKYETLLKEYDAVKNMVSIDLGDERGDYAGSVVYDAFGNVIGERSDRCRALADFARDGGDGFVEVPEKGGEL